MKDTYDHDKYKYNPAFGNHKAKSHEKKKELAKKISKGDKLEAASKKAGFYVHGHKNFGDVYEA